MAFIDVSSPSTLFGSSGLFPFGLAHLNIEKNLSIKLASPPPTLISVSLSHGKGSSGLVASKRSSIEIFGFECPNGTTW